MIRSLSRVTASGFSAPLRWLPLVLVLACGGSGGGGGGDGTIGGDAVTRGVASATGSVTAAGTRYDTDTAQVFFDGLPGDAADLLPGMSVRVEGVRMGDGSQGEADRVDADAVLAGQITSNTTDTVVPGRLELTILGQAVQVDEGFTEFDPMHIDPMDVVGVYGYPDGVGGVVATRIEMRSDPNEVTLRGEVESLDAMAQTFMIGSVEVAFDDAATLLPDGTPEDGDVVIVNGLLLMSGDIDATSSDDRVAIVSDAGDVTDYQLEGIVSDFGSLNDPFLVDGQPVDASGLGVLFQPQPQPGGVPFVENGVLVEIEGSLVDGVVVPSIVILRGDGGRVSAQLTADSKDDVEQTLMLLESAPMQGDGILVETDDATRYVGCDGFDDPLLVPGAFADVRVVIFGSRVFATTIACSVTPAGPVRVVGRVRGFDGTFEMVNLLGLEIQLSAGTVFEGFPNPPGVTSVAEFFSYVSSNSTVRLEVEDDDGTFTTLDVADRVRRAEDD